MAINPIKLTRGFGNGTFIGTIARLVTQGFAIGEVIAPPPPFPNRTATRTSKQRGAKFSGLNRSAIMSTKNRTMK
jgi:hypothetical protein